MAWAHPFPTSPKPAMRTFLPAIITSVALLIPSMSECLQPQMLSNLDLVTLSFTLIQGQMSLFWSISLQSRATPVVVSSEIPRRSLVSFEKYVLSSARLSWMVLQRQYSSSETSDLPTILTSSPFASFFSMMRPSIMNKVASPPSSTMSSGPWPFSQVRQSLVSFQYSSMVSPFQAKTLAVSALAIAAAAWSWVEKMLQLHHLTLAPRAWRVSIRQAVWIVMWSDPEILAPLNGFFAPNSSRRLMRPGISTSARSSSFLPQSARLMSLTIDQSDIFFNLIL